MKDCLDKMTKEELIWFIRSHYFYRDPPRFSDVLSRRWETASKKVKLKRDRNHEKFLLIDGKEQDDLIRQLNKTTDTKKMKDLLERMKPFHKKMDQFMKEDHLVRVEEKKVDKLYKSIDIQRKKEQLENEKNKNI